MEEVKRKLETSSLTSVREAAVHKLGEIIAKKHRDQPTNKEDYLNNDFEPLAFLWEQAKSPRADLAAMAAAKLSELAAKSVIDPAAFLSSVVAMAYELKHLEGLVAAVAGLLASKLDSKDTKAEDEYGIGSKVHPYVTFLRSRKDEPSTRSRTHPPDLGAAAWSCS